MRILIQFIGQAIGLLLLRKARAENTFPYKMPLFPLPVFVAIAIWLFILYSTGLRMAGYGLIVIGLGAIVFFIKANLTGEWPFSQPSRDNPVINEA